MSSIKYDGPGLKGNIDPDKEMEDTCDGCGTTLKFKYEVTSKDSPFWFSECSCGHITINWDHETGGDE